MQFLVALLGVDQRDADADGRLGLNFVAFRVNNGNVKQPGQAHVVRVQGGGRLLPVGFPQVAAFRDFHHFQLGVFRNLGLRAVGYFDLIGQAVRGQHLLGDLFALNHAVNREAVGTEGHGIDGFAVVDSVFIGFGSRLDHVGFVVLDMDRLHVVFFGQFDHVPEDDLYVDFRLGLNLFPAADKRDIEIPLKGDLAPFLVQRLVRHAAVQGVFISAGHDFPDLQFRIRRETGFRPVGRGDQIIWTVIFLGDCPDLDRFNNRVSEGIHGIVRDEEFAVFFLQDPGVFPGHETGHAFRDLRILIGQRKAAFGLDRVALRVGNGQGVEQAAFIRDLLFPGFVLFVPDRLRGGFQRGVKFHSLHRGYGQHRSLGNAGFGRKFHQDGVFLCFRGQGTGCVLIFRNLFGFGFPFCFRRLLFRCFFRLFGRFLRLRFFFRGLGNRFLFLRNGNRVGINIASGVRKRGYAAGRNQHHQRAKPGEKSPSALDAPVVLLLIFRVYHLHYLACRWG